GGDVVLDPITAGNPSVLERGEFRVDSDTTITFVTPAHQPGPVDVTVTAGGPTSNLAEFTFTPDDGIDVVEPDHGPDDGGDPDDQSTWVTINGRCFLGAT